MKLKRPETYPVAGFVFVGDKPAAGAKVQLNPTSTDPLDMARLAGAYPHALVDKDGSFHLTTYNTNDGAPAGSYGITVTWPLPLRPNHEQGPDRLQGRYSDRRRPVAEVQITSGENDLGTIRLR
jgi:hypothetical protein